MNTISSSRFSFKSTDSNHSTDIDSSFDYFDDLPLHSHSTKHKTELCKNYSLLGYCSYF